MDTRFWGPSGWQLYHLVAQTYPDTPDAQTARKYEQFFLAMKDILPCRFCRESTTKFMDELPLHPALKSKDCLVKWMYDLHNMVNHKLRSQCQEDPKIVCPPPDPTIQTLKDVYEELLSSKPSVPPGLDFLFCVAYNYKTNSSSDTVQAYYQTFINLIDLYPFAELRAIIKQHIHHHMVYSALKTRETFVRWWYNLAKKLCNKTGFEIGSFRGTLQKYGKYKSGCTRGKTCRNGKKIRDHRKTYKITHDRLLHVSRGNIE
jgi:hypothetical protein